MILQPVIVMPGVGGWSFVTIFPYQDRSHHTNVEKYIIWYVIMASVCESLQGYFAYKGPYSSTYPEELRKKVKKNEKTD